MTKMKIKLFSQIMKGTAFFFIDKPDRILVKSNKSHYIAPEGRRQAHPHVLVAEKKPEKSGK